jgi:hypothetical protein
LVAGVAAAAALAGVPIAQHDAAAARRNASIPVTDGRAQPHAALPLQLRHPRSRPADTSHQMAQDTTGHVRLDRVTLDPLTDPGGVQHQVEGGLGVFPARVSGGDQGLAQ